MNVALWIVASVLSLGYMAGGVAMLMLSKERFRALGKNQHYVDDFSPGFIKMCGVLKVLASVGLILPPLLDIAPQLAAWAALGLVLFMTGAAMVRIMRKEWRYMLGDMMFIALAGFVAWGRFGPESFLG